MSEPFDDPTKEAYRKLFQDWGLKAETEYPVFHRSRRIDLVVDCSPSDWPRLQDTVFSYFRLVNAVEFKGPRDPLTLRNFSLVMSRSWGLGAMERQTAVRRRMKQGTPGDPERSALPMDRTVTVVCVARPDHVLNALAFERERPGIYMRDAILPVRVIVPSALELEERNYPLLPLARGSKLQEFVLLCVGEGLYEYLQVALDVGVIADAMDGWRGVIGMGQMRLTFPQDIVDLIEDAFRKDPELPMRFPSIRNAWERMHEESVQQRVQEQVRHTRGQDETKIRQEALLRQMRHRFPDLPPAVVQRVETTTEVPTLDAWLMKILDARSLEEMGFEKNA